MKHNLAYLFDVSMPRTNGRCAPSQERGGSPRFGTLCICDFAVNWPRQTHNKLPLVIGWCYRRASDRRRFRRL